MHKSLNIISLDWISGTGTLISPPLPPFDPGFDVEFMPHGTRVFNNWARISYYNRPLIELLYNPKTPILSPHTCHWKISNEYLYQWHGIDSGITIFERIGITNAKPTRIDVCADFNLLNNNLNPASFITRIVRGIYCRKYAGRFKVEGTQSRQPVYHYLRYGSHSSPVSFYLYNKTKELSEVKDKPYIRTIWSKYGLKQNIDVWRMEFSIKDTRLQFLNKDTSETLNLHNFNYATRSHIGLLFDACLSRYGSFVINNRTTNISRMKPISLITPMLPNTATYMGPVSHASNNLNKFVIKQLMALEHEMRIIKSYPESDIAKAISNYETMHGLQGYSANLMT